MDKKTSYIKDKPQKATDWISKEKRELFCKTVNSYIMKTGAEKDPIMDTVLQIAKQVVDTAFENYPDDTETEEEFEFPNNNEPIKTG